MNIFLLRFSVDVALFILIWLVQVIIYPSFQYTDTQQFDYWHMKYMGLITFFVGPLMLLQVVAIGYQLLYEFHWAVLVAAVCVGLIWLSTVVLSIPCHTALQNSGFDLLMIKKLITTNWYRTVLWTVVLALSLFR